MNRKQKAFALFEQGMTTHSPEVKALKLKSQTKYNYFYEWQKSGQVSQSSSSGEAVGSIDETKQVKKEAPALKLEESKDNDLGKSGEDKPEEDLEPGEANLENPPKPDESIGAVDETGGKGKKKDEEEKEAKSKYEITVADQGIKCTVYLSLQTLALYEIAAAKQTQLAKDGEAKLTLGDYLDNCSEHFFKDRKLKLGLIEL